MGVLGCILGLAIKEVVLHLCPALLLGCQRVPAPEVLEGLGHAPRHRGDSSPETNSLFARGCGAINSGCNLDFLVAFFLCNSVVTIDYTKWKMTGAASAAD